MIGSRLTGLREERGLTQSELARRADLTPAAVWQIENDKRQPNSGTLQKLAEALGVSLDTLMGRQSDEDLLNQDDSARVLLRGFQDLSDQDKDTVRKIVESLRRRQGGGER